MALRNKEKRRETRMGQQKQRQKSGGKGHAYHLEKETNERGQKEMDVRYRDKTHWERNKGYINREKEMEI